MRKITKIRRSIKAISPIIATLLLIAIAVVASLVVYAWVMGYIGIKTNQAGNAVQIQSQAFNSAGTQLTVYVQNVGQGTEQLNYPSNTVYVNTVPQTIVTVTPSSMLSGNTTISLGPGQTVGLTVNYAYVAGQQIVIKVVTSTGTITQYTVPGMSSNSGTGGSGGTSITLDSQSGPAGSSVGLSGSGFADTSTLTVKFNGAAATTSPATLTSTATGAIPTGVTFTVPSGTSTGSYSVTVTDASLTLQLQATR